MTKSKEQVEQVESAIYESEGVDPAEDPVEEDIPTAKPVEPKDK